MRLGATDHAPLVLGSPPAPAGCGGRLYPFTVGPGALPGRGEPYRASSFPPLMNPLVTIQSDRPVIPPFVRYVLSVRWLLKFVPLCGMDVGIWSFPCLPLGK